MICFLDQRRKIIGEIIKIEMFDIMQQHYSYNRKSPQGINNSETFGTGIHEFLIIIREKFFISDFK
jgi:hypothetical protein